MGTKGEDFSSLLTEPKASVVNEVVEKVVEVISNQPAIDLSSIKAKAVRMPKMSDTMIEGVIAKWLKKEGDKVKSGDIIAEVETDKATMEFESFNSGTLLYIGIKEGESAACDSLLAIIGKEGEDISDLINSTPAKVETSTPEEVVEEPTTSAAQPTTALPKGVVVVTMPRLSDTMEEGTVATWLKKVGDKISEGDILAEIETDKATMEVMPYVDGTLLYVGVKEGEAAKINEIIAIVGKAGTDVTAYLASERNQEVATKETAPAAANAPIIPIISPRIIFESFTDFQPCKREDAKPVSFACFDAAPFGSSLSPHTVHAANAKLAAFT